jgi:hypothetical protein
MVSFSSLQLTLRVRPFMLHWKADSSFLIAIFVLHSVIFLIDDNCSLTTLYILLF